MSGRNIGTDKPERMGVEPELAGQGPVVPVLLRAAGADPAAHAAGRAGIERQLARQFMLADLAGDAAVAQIQRLDASIEEMSVDGRVGELRVEAAAPGLAGGTR